MLVPQWSYLPDFKEKNTQFKGKQKEQFDRRHGTRELPDIPDDSEVWITSEDKPIPGRVVAAGETPRSYIVETDSGQLQRNRCQINVALTPDPSSSLDDSAVELQQSQSVCPDPPRRILTRTQTGTDIQPPERLA